ncbi:MAG: nucleoside-diphosphate kinase [Bacillota bacterium]
MERTFVMIKPDGVQRGLIGEITARFEKKGFKIVGMKLLKVSEELAAKHYAEHQGKGFYPGLVKFITSGPVIAIVVEGKNAVAEVRKLNGVTNPADAQSGTIRGDFAQEIGRNVIHGSDSLENAQREIAIYFNSDELVEYEYLPEKWLYE